MKKLLFILSVTFLSFVSCKNKNGKEMSIAGKWKFVEMNMPGMTAEDIKEFIEQAVIEFTADGKFIATRKDTKHEGSYVFDTKTKSLTTSDSGEPSVQEYTVGWEGEKLLLTNEEGTVKLKRQ